METRPYYKARLGRLPRKKRDRIGGWLDTYIPPSPERKSTVEMIRRASMNGQSNEALAQAHSLPLECIRRITRYRTNFNPCPKHDGSGLQQCSPQCPGCLWEASELLRLGPCPPVDPQSRRPVILPNGSLP